MTRVVFVVPEDLRRPTGGNRYDTELAAALEQLGVHVELRGAAGQWPEAAGPDRERLGRLLRSTDAVLVDGLVACGAPDAVAPAVAAGSRVTVLVHMPLALDTGLTPATAAVRDALEGNALRAASAVLATSRWTAEDLRSRHGLPAVEVAVPGAAPAPVAPGSEPPVLRHLAAVSPVKDQLTVVEALARLVDRPWTAELTGALDVDADYAAAVRQRIEEYGLGDRVRLTGPLTGDVLDQAWAATDVLLLPSRAETWGMVVTEALARGIPAVVSRGTGAEEALGRTTDGELPGAVVEPGSPTELAAALAHLLGPGRSRAREAARLRREMLPRWHDTARTVREALA